MKEYALIGLGGIILSAMLYFGYNKIIDLEKQNETLTNQLIQVTHLLEGEVERSKNVEAATERLEKNDAERQQQLRGFERNLSKIARDSKEARLILSTVIPDSMLDGLRSFQNTDRQLSGQPSAATSTGSP